MGVREVVKWSFQARITQDSQQFENSFSTLSYSCSNKQHPDQGTTCFVDAKKLVLGKWAFTEMV